MKKVKLNIIIALIFLSSAYSFAQSYTFKVLASSGSNTKSTSALVVGSVLSSTDQISVGAGSYLNLMYLAGGGAVQINKSGTYSINDLARQVESSKSSSGGKFVNYVIGEVTKSGGDINQNHSSYMRVTGSQERAINSAYAIGLLLPTSSKTMDSKVFVNWLPLENTSKYIVKVTDLGDAVVGYFETDKTTFMLDMSTIKYSDTQFADATTIQVTIISKEDPSKTSEPVAVSKFDGKESDDLKNKYNTFKASNSAEGMPEVLKKLNEATFFEGNNAIVDAIRCYEEALLDSEADTYQVGMAYGGYLRRLFIKEGEKK